MIRPLLALVTAAWASAAAAVSPSDFVGADIIILGEVHDNPAHHEVQANAVAVISPTAIVWEMISPQNAGLVDPNLDVSDQAAALGWAETGWPDFTMYHPIITAAGSAAHYGAAVPPEVARSLMSSPLEEKFEDAALFGLDRSLPEAEQTARNQLQFEAHCEMLPAEMAPTMVDIQRLRDARFAQVAIAAWRDTGGPVVVITGNGHARKDWGVPRFIARAAPDAVVLSVGQSEDGVAPEGGFDLLFDSPAIDRPDPCDAFR